MGAPIVMAVAGLASTALSAYSSIESGRQQRKWANYQAGQAEADSRAERDAAVIQAEKIRKLARIQASSARAALAASGVDAGEGTAININQEIYGSAEEDAMTAIYGGIAREKRGRAEAAGMRTKGKQAERAGYINAASTVLSGASSAFMGWKGAPKTKTSSTYTGEGFVSEKPFGNKGWSYK